MGKKMTRLVQYFGANTENAPAVGRLLDGCKFVGIPFAGGMSEVPYIKAKILANDLHRHIINLCEVVANDAHREWLAREADKFPFHPDVLAEAQKHAANWRHDDPDNDWETDCSAALWYFVCNWMGRGGEGGTPGEFKGKLAVRWNADGGGSNTRYRTAIAALDAWGKAFKRCEFECMDALDFLEKFQDREDHGLFVDAPWPNDGDRYTHKFSKEDQRELAAWLEGFAHTRIVVRYGDHPLIRRLYPETRHRQCLKTPWTWIPLDSRTQANERKPEFLIVNFLS
jgi:site-specific DNA-adenine methylase